MLQLRSKDWKEEQYSSFGFVDEGFQPEQSVECGLGNTFVSYEIGCTLCISLICFFTGHGGILLCIQEYKCICYTYFILFIIYGSL